MAKPKFTLTPAATFKQTVSIPVAGDKPAKVEFTFKHRPREQFKEFMDNLNGAENVDVLLDIASGWELVEPFDKENLQKLCDSYMGAAHEILTVYIDEMTGQGPRVKN